MINEMHGWPGLHVDTTAVVYLVMMNVMTTLLLLLSVSRSRAKLAGDTSLMTYRGHCVLNTLVRSRFSPVFNTGQRYIYVGCATGAVVGNYTCLTLVSYLL